MTAETPGTPVLAATHILQQFDVNDTAGRKIRVNAVSGVSLQIRAGETLALVGETGSGKSTLARALLQAPRPTSGSVVFRGVELTRLVGRELVSHRRHMQMVFQDPFGSLDPTWAVSSIVEEPLIGYASLGRVERRRRVGELLEKVGLSPAIHGRRRPRELSGGQCQRVAIARALALDPALIICDEALSSLDTLVQAQVSTLFEQLRAELGLAYLFVAHDLALVRHVSDRIAVMHAGQLCEVGPTDLVYRQPLHPHTAALLESIPRPDTRRTRRPRTANQLVAEPSSLQSPGCRFRARCPRAQERCAVENPALRAVHGEQQVACHFPLPY